MNGFSHRNRDGSPKARLTRAVAIARCGSHDHLVAYKCSTCKGWHVGHGNTRHEDQRTTWSRTWDLVREQLELTA